MQHSGDVAPSSQLGQAAVSSGSRPGTWTLLASAFTFAIMLVALYATFLYAPAEAVQGNVFRIFYVHLSLAWLAYLAFVVVFVGSVGYLWRQTRGWDHLAKASAEIGVLFTTLVLVTGSIWARPVWGVWWTWDARLTTSLVLWFIYVGYLMLRGAIGDRERAARAAAVVGVLGFVDVPISFLSVFWWRTVHPPATTVAESGGLTPEMRITLLLMLVAFTALYVFLLRFKMVLEGLRDSVWDMERDRTS